LGNFLAIVFSRDFQSEADRLFRSGLDLARHVKSQTPSRVLELEWVRVASFPRTNGSGTPIVSDPETGSWLLAIGSWFHFDNFASGAEPQLLKRYIEVGPNRLAQELEGFFLIVIGDGRTKETLALTDLVGSCHGFVRAWSHGVGLSSSSLLLAGLENVNLDYVSCQEFICTGIIYEDRTVYREVRKLEPATVLRFAGGALKTKQRYWDITDTASEPLEGQSAVRSLSENLVYAAQRIGRSFARPICDLTGGYDSRAVVAAFLTAGVRFSTVVSGPPESRDVIVSRGIAEMLGLPHLHITPNGNTCFKTITRTIALTDGEYDLFDYARILDVHQRLAEQFDISINGSFGEVGRGYWWELLFPFAGMCRKVDARKISQLRYAAYSYDVSLFRPETRLDLVSHFAQIVEQTNAKLSTLPNTLQMDHAYLMLRMQRWQGRIASSTDQLWPCLSPFLFRSVLESMLRTSPSLRRRNLLIRRMLAQLQPRLADFPLEHGYPALPVTWQTFHRFWPLPIYYAKRILSKANLYLGSRKQVSLITRNDNLLVRLQLWREEEVEELLCPGEMRLGALLERSAVEAFLEFSKQESFPFHDQWTRLLTLEYTLRTLEAIRTH
jgi:asparagine synthase (glutamine-hydrolysing)